MAILGKLSRCVLAASVVASCGSGTVVAPIAETRVDATQTAPANSTGAPAATTSRPSSTTPSSTVAPTSGALTVTIIRTGYGSLSARTAPGATCNASARLPSGRTSTAQGLDTHQADATGNISWTYQTVSNTGSGTGTYTVTCSSGGQSKTVTAAFTVP